MGQRRLDLPWFINFWRWYPIWNRVSWSRFSPLHIEQLLISWRKCSVVYSGALPPVLRNMHAGKGEREKDRQFWPVFCCLTHQPRITHIDPQGCRMSIMMRIIMAYHDSNFYRHHPASSTIIIIIIIIISFFFLRTWEYGKFLKF